MHFSQTPEYQAAAANVVAALDALAFHVPKTDSALVDRIQHLARNEEFHLFQNDLSRLTDGITEHLVQSLIAEEVSEQDALTAATRLVNLELMNGLTLYRIWAHLGLGKPSCPESFALFAHHIMRHNIGACAPVIAAAQSAMSELQQQA